MNRIVQNALNLLFPPRCGSCRKLIDWDAPHSLCPRCLETVAFTAERETCNRCGRPLKMHWGVCEECRKTKRYFSLHLSCCVYQDAVRSMILRLKFSGRRELARELGRMMTERLNGCIGFAAPDVVTCVPMTAQKQKKREYNQSELLAREIASHFKWPLAADALLKIKDTRTQSTLSQAQRRENVRGAYAIGKSEAVRGKRVLLVDDVYTTGATANEIARVLRRNGAIDVTVITAAITDRQD